MRPTVKDWNPDTPGPNAEDDGSHEYALKYALNCFRSAAQLGKKYPELSTLEFVIRRSLGDLEPSNTYARNRLNRQSQPGV